jgi:hypothetical protein
MLVVPQITYGNMGLIFLSYFHGYNMLCSYFPDEDGRFSNPWRGVGGYLLYTTKMKYLQTIRIIECF